MYVTEKAFNKNELEEIRLFANEHNILFDLVDASMIKIKLEEALTIYIIRVNGQEGTKYTVEAYKMTRVARKSFAYMASVLKYIEFEYLPHEYREGISLKPEQEEKLVQLVKETITDKEEKQMRIEELVFRSYLTKEHSESVKAVNEAVSYTEAKELKRVAHKLEEIISAFDETFDNEDSPHATDYRGLTWKRD